MRPLAGKFRVTPLPYVVIAPILASGVIPLTQSISWFSRNPPAVEAECRVSQLGTPHTAWSLIIQASGRVVADDSMAADGQMGGELSMRDRKSFSRPALREAAG